MNTRFNFTGDVFAYFLYKLCDNVTFFPVLIQSGFVIFACWCHYIHKNVYQITSFC